MDGKISVSSLRCRIGKLLDLLVFAFLFFLIFDPSNRIFHAKDAAFFCMFFVFLLYCMTERRIRVDKTIVFVFLTFGLLIPLYGYVVGIIRNIGFSNEMAINFLKPFLMLFLLVIWGVLKRDYEKYLVFSLTLLSILILSVYLLVLFDLGSLLRIVEWLMEKEVAMIGFREFGELTTPMIFYKTSPLLVFATAHYLEKDRSVMDIFFAVVCTLALVFSGTRSNMLVAVLLLVSAFLFCFKGRLSVKIPLLAVFILSLFPVWSSFLLHFLDPAEPSSEVKLLTIPSYIAAFLNDNITLLVGQGIGTSFYSIGRGEDIYISELAYFDLLRQYGLPVFTVMLIILYYPVVKIWSRSRIKAIGYCMYLFIAGTNPLIVSSTGMLAISYGYYLAYFRPDPGMPGEMNHG